MKGTKLKNSNVDFLAIAKSFERILNSFESCIDGGNGELPDDKEDIYKAKINIKTLKEIGNAQV
jgi:hypothetical protein